MPVSGRSQDRERHNESIYTGNGCHGGDRRLRKSGFVEHVLMVITGKLCVKCGSHQLSWNVFIRFELSVWLAVLLLAPVHARALDGAIAEKAMKSIVSVLPTGSRKEISAKEPEGSGVAVLGGRYILTVLHVFNDASEIRVRTFDGEIISAQVAGRDTASDLALLKIDQALPTLEPGGDPQIGSQVCAIGNAFGLGLSLSCGTVSAVHRTKTGFNPVEDFVQTDAAVNPGASGGALIDQQGRLVGILSAIFTKSADANIGVNFAVSEPLALRVAKSLQKRGKMVWDFGGAVLKLHPGKRETGRLGGKIVKITKGTSVDDAGLQVNDVIFTAGGRRIRKPEDFYSGIARLGPNAEIEIAYRRNDADMRTTLIMK